MSTRKGRNSLSAIKKEFKKRRISGGGRTAAGGGRRRNAAIDDECPKPPVLIDPFAKLPAELEAEIFSRAGMTLNEAARCSLLSKRWRETMQLRLSSGGGALDFVDENKLRKTLVITPEEQSRFANRVDQAMGSVQGWDELRIGFNLLNMSEEAWRWVQLGLTKRVKRLTLASSFIHWFRLGLSLPLFDPAFLCKQDLTRLEVLELEGVTKLHKETLDYIFSNCTSLKRFALHNCYIISDHGEFMRSTTIRVSCPASSNLESLSLRFLYCDYRDYNDVDVSQIELISAPRLRFFELNVEGETTPMEVVFGRDIPQLGELRLTGPWLRCSRARRYRLESQHLELEFSGRDFSEENRVPIFKPPSEWPPSGNVTVTVLDLHIRGVDKLPSLLDCTDILRAAPKLRHLCLWFENNVGPEQWRKRDDDGGDLLWKHQSLQVLHLYGVHPKYVEGRVDPRILQLELAAYIIANSPSLSHVLIDTKRFPGVSNRRPELVELDRLYAIYELEGQLLQYPHCTTSHIHFTYQ